MQKLGMKPVPGVSRVTIKKSKNVRSYPQLCKPLGAPAALCSSSCSSSSCKLQQGQGMAGGISSSGRATALSWDQDEACR